MYSQFTVVSEFERLPHIIVNIVWAATIFYLFYFYFIRFFEKALFVRYLIYSILMSIAITFVYTPIHRFYLNALRIFDVEILGPHIIGSFILAQCGSLVRGFENWTKQIQQKAALETQNLKNELEILKSQINPHFLFNTLNNIDTLIFKSQKNASSSLITLSEMLRYMIYDTNTQRVPLNKEINYLKQYITLQQLRFKDKNFINCQWPKDCSNLNIAPLLLIPFVENAYKYASASTLPSIKVNMHCSDKQLHFSCSNPFTNDDTKETHAGGVGIENVKRRLALIYPNKHELEISKQDGFFTVNLHVQL